MQINQLKRREFITLLGGAAVCPLAARAQQPDRMRLIGVLMGGVENDPVVRPQLATFRGALAKLGWTEASNLRIEVRWCADAVLCARYAADLVALGPKVLLAVSTPSLAALQQQTRTIPIVFAGVADPVGQGFVASLARPGGNITGFSVFEAPIAGKMLEMLTQITPPVERVAILFNPAATPYASLMLHAIEEAASSFAVAVQRAPVNSDGEFESMMAELARQERAGVLVLPSIFIITHREAIIALAARHHLPAVYSFAFFAEAGGLMSYGVDIGDLTRRAADYVDRILKGTNPGDLPVQMPIKFYQVINLKTAKALDITIAPSLLATADRVIE
jgi:putative tryptophan/tyrosine transport system substrate-binding protein